MSPQELVEAVAQAATEVLFPWSQMPFEGRIMAFQEAARYVTGLRNNPMLLLALFGIEEEYNDYDVAWRAHLAHHKDYQQEWDGLDEPANAYTIWAIEARNLRQRMEDAKTRILHTIYQRMHGGDTELSGAKSQ